MTKMQSNEILCKKINKILDTVDRKVLEVNVCKFIHVQISYSGHLRYLQTDHFPGLQEASGLSPNDKDAFQ